MYKILHNTWPSPQPSPPPPPSALQSCMQICVKCTKVEHVLDLRQTATKFAWRAGCIKVQLKERQHLYIQTTSTSTKCLLCVCVYIYIYIYIYIIYTYKRARAHTHLWLYVNVRTSRWDSSSGGGSSSSCTKSATGSEWQAVFWLVDYYFRQTGMLGRPCLHKEWSWVDMSYIYK